MDSNIFVDMINFHTEVFLLRITLEPKEVKTRLISIVSQPIKVVVAVLIVIVVFVVVVVMVVVDPRNLPLKSGQNWVLNS